MNQPAFKPLANFRRYPPQEMATRARAFYDEVNRRRTVREFESTPVPPEVIEDCLRAAGTAPSGANLQPWRFVVVSDPAVKARVREAAEKEEQAFYRERAPREWLEALAPLGTDENKPFLEEAPLLIVAFGERYGIGPDGRKHKRYYVDESVGLACGVLLAALHHAGLATLTHTPSPMGFLSELLERPENERPFLLIVVGYPSADARVPCITRKALSEIATFV